MEQVIRINKAENGYTVVTEGLEKEGGFFVKCYVESKIEDVMKRVIDTTENYLCNS